MSESIESIHQWAVYLEKNPNSALEKIYHLHHSKLVFYVMKQFSFNKEISTDLSHQAIVQFYLNTINNKIKNKSGPLKPYLVGIVRNLSHEYIRQKKKNDSLQTIPILINNNEIYGFNEEVDSRIQSLQENYSKLGNSCKEILKLFYFQNYSLTKIMSLLNYKSTDSVKTQKYKCIKKLRSLIKESKH